MNISLGCLCISSHYLPNAYDWKTVNKLQLHSTKTDDVLFHVINKNIEGVIPELGNMV